MANDLVSCCSEVIGGEVYIFANFTQSGGSEYYEALGDVRIQPARIERTAGSSSAGRIWVTEAARPIRAIMSFVNRCDQNPVRLYCERCLVDITVVEKSRGFFHSFTQSLIVGAPEINLSTGEISGIEIVTDDYTMQQSNEVLGKYCPPHPDIRTPDDGPLVGPRIG
jgi:hypothetical protein